jgi:hypothetical protein
MLRQLCAGWLSIEGKQASMKVSKTVKWCTRTGPRGLRIPALTFTLAKKGRALAYPERPVVKGSAQ